MLTQRRIPEVLRDRPARIGDAFAVMLERRNARQLLHPIGPVVDVTADARDAARAAFYGAVASPLDPSAATAVAEPAEDRIEPVPEPEDWALQAADSACPQGSARRLDWDQVKTSGFAGGAGLRFPHFRAARIIPTPTRQGMPPSIRPDMTMALP